MSAAVASLIRFLTAFGGDVSRCAGDAGRVRRRPLLDRLGKVRQVRVAAVRHTRRLGEACEVDSGCVATEEGVARPLQQGNDVLRVCQRGAGAGMEGGEQQHACSQLDGV